MSNKASSLKRKYEDIDNNNSHEDCVLMGVKSSNGEIISKINSPAYFPWDEVRKNNFSTRYILSLLQEMTPYATAETEDFIVIIYSPTKVIGGADIAKLLNATHLSFSESDASLPSCTPSPSPPQRTSIGRRAINVVKKVFNL